MKDAAWEIIETVTRHPIRALTTCFGVFWGIFMLTLLLAGGTGLRNGMHRIFAGEGRNSIWIQTARTSRAFEGLGTGRPIRLEIDDVDALMRGSSDLINLSPRQHLEGDTSITYGVHTASVSVSGVNPGYFEVQRAELTRGRLLNQIDVARARKVVVIGKGARALLFQEVDPVGRMLSIGGAEFLVVGEFTDPSGADETLRMFIPYSTLASTFDGSGRTEAITATVRDGAPDERVRRQVTQLLAHRHRFDPKDGSALRLWFSEERRRKIRGVLHGIDVAVLIVGLGTLLSGMVGVSNILFVGVRERTKEFAIRRALGATARSVLTMVISEAVCLAGLAGSLGLLSASALVQLARHSELRSDYFLNPGIDLEAILASLGMLVLSALLAGYFPAREAARMHPN